MSNHPQYLVNGRSDLQISPLDRGFAYGDGVFRTLRICKGKPHSWQLHYRKLLEDCNRIAIVCPSADLLLADLQRLFTDQDDAVAKIIITRGEGARGYALPALAQPLRIVLKSSMPDYPKDNFSAGVSLHLCKLRLRHQPELAGIKHLNRLENVMARMEWNSTDVADGLLLDSEGYVIECTMSNLFARFGKRLLTPNLSNCGVAGITRQQILDHSSQLGLQPGVSEIALAELMLADELIICNSIYGAWQVINFNNKQWPQQGLAAQLRHLLQEQA